MKHTSIKRKSIKALALTLALIMLFGISPLAALAENEDMEFSTQSSGSDDITASFVCPVFLESVRRWSVGKPHPAPILRSDVAGIGRLFGFDGITSYAGIEHFTALTHLSVRSNELTTLDVSKNTALESIYIITSQLTSLDVSNNTALKYLEIHNSRLTALDVSNNVALELLWVVNNSLTSLDVSKNTALSNLDVSDNQLTSLILSPDGAYWRVDVRNNRFESTSAIINGPLARWDTVSLQWHGIAGTDIIYSTEVIRFQFSPQRTNRFKDVPNAPNWQNAPVTWAERSGITTGSPAGSDTFKPNDTISRAEFITFLHRVYGSPSATRATFRDMPNNAAFQNAISWAFAEGITTGSPAGSSTFMPNDNITREQIAAMLYRYVGEGVPAPEDRLGGFTDRNMISTWAGARDAVNWAAYHGIMGQNTTTLNPRGNATRAEAVTMLFRVVETFNISAP